MNESFRREVNYSVVYEDEHFDVRSRYLGQATLDGPFQAYPWSVDISLRPQTLYADIFRAAHDYYHFNNRHNINTPPQSFWYDIKIGAFDDDDGSVNGDFSNARYWLTADIFPQIRVYHNNRSSTAIYSTTIHELAHAAHWDLDGRWLNADNNVFETWARAVQWVFTNDTYSRLGFSINFQDGWQNLDSDDIPMKDGYTPLFIDLIDNNNQRGSSGNPKLPFDNVSGFTLNDIQNALENSDTFSEIRDKLISLNRAPRADVETLFDFYINTVKYNK